MTDARPRITDSFTEALKAEIVSGSENLFLWLNFVQETGGLDKLFELETWLKGLRSYFDAQHLPMTESDRVELDRRSFAPELRVVRSAMLLCEELLARVSGLGQPDRLEFEAFSGQTRAASGSEHHMGRLLEQPTPIDSLARLMDSLSDLRILVEGVTSGARQDYQIFLSFGRLYQKELRGCRYVDMLLSQRFRLQYDRVDNPVLSGVLRSIPEDSLRRDVALALLYMLRFLKYLRLIEVEMTSDHPLRHVLALFALLHEEIGKLSDFLRSRFLKRKETSQALRSATEFVLHSLSTESQRALQRELLFLARETEAPAIYMHVENSHGLVRHCLESCTVSLVRVFDHTLEARKLFPAMLEAAQKSVKLRQELWDLRDYMKQTLETRGNVDVVRIVSRLNLFRESSLRALMYRDWAQFEQFSDQIVACGDQVEVRTFIRRLVGYIENLVQEVSKRSVLQDPSAEPIENQVSG
jgi:hypothetical protein